jgi:hypothetical protein
LSFSCFFVDLGVLVEAGAVPEDLAAWEDEAGAATLGDLLLEGFGVALEDEDGAFAFDEEARAAFLRGVEDDIARRRRISLLEKWLAPS